MRLPDTFPADIAYPSCLGLEHLRDLDPSSAITSIRLHPIKGRHLTDYPDPVPWHMAGRYLEIRPSFGLDPDWHTGAYYVQDASSMLLSPALAATGIDPADQPAVLDLCGAPGGKSTLIAEWLDGQGCLVSNEVIQSRSTTLAQNLTKAGYSNVMVTQMDPAALGKAEGLFDIVVVDAPCSGEGLWRKTPHSIAEWSVDHVKLCSSRQRRILDDIIPALKPGGYLIYATCTYNDYENIDQVDQLAERHGLDSIDISIEGTSLETITGLRASGIQAIAGKARGEGQFVAVLHKPGNRSATEKVRTVSTLTKKQKALASPLVTPHALDHPAVITKAGILYLIPSDLLTIYHLVYRLGRVVRTGLLVGKLSDRLLLPSHELAQSLDINGTAPVTEVDIATSLAYMRRDPQRLDSADLGWIQIQYKANTLGWAKNLGKRINNYLPKGLVIR